MTVAELKAALKTPPIPWLVLAGEEEYLKRHYLKEIRKTLIEDEALAPFNHLRFEGESLDFGKLYDAVKAPPVFAEYKLIEWHLCDFEKMKAEDLRRLTELCEEKDSYPGVTVLFYAEAERLSPGQNPKKPAKRYTEVEKALPVVLFPRSTDTQLLGWIARHLSHEGITAGAAVGRALLERCGHGMDVLAGELDKLTAYAHAKGRTELLEADVREVTAATFEADAFGLGNAILAHDAAAAYENLRDMKNRRLDPSLIFGSVFRLFCDLFTVALLREEGLSPAAIRERTGLHEYKVTLYLRATAGRTAASLGKTVEKCRRLDLAGKSGAADYAGLERLIAEESLRA